VFGAVYLDQGLDAVRSVAERLFEGALAALPEAAALKDPKTRLQEWLQGRGHALPAYTVLEVSGEPHEQRFRVRCDVPGLALQVVAEGSSRRRAEQEAAQRILEDPALKSSR
jgi:ribonuclease-3